MIDRFGQLENELAPIVIMLFGSVMLVSAVHPAKAFKPIEVTPFGITMLVTFLLFWNAPFPMEVTASPLVFAGITTVPPRVHEETVRLEPLVVKEIGGVLSNV